MLGWTKQRFMITEELFCDLKNTLHYLEGYIVEASLFAPSLFLLSGTKSSLKNKLFRASQKLCRGEPQQHWKAIVLFFSILPLHTSQSPDNLLIIPRHLDKRKRKLLSVFFHHQLWDERNSERSWSQAWGSNGRMDTWLRIPIDLLKSGDNANSDSTH